MRCSAALAGLGDVVRALAIEMASATNLDQDGAVSADRYADRLGPDRYRDDPFVGVFDYDHAAPAEAWVPERLWRRIHALGVAYELHHLTLTDGGSEPRLFNSTQAHALLDELEFVGRLVDERLLHEHLSAVVRVVVSSVRGGQNPALRIEGQ